MPPGAPQPAGQPAQEGQPAEFSPQQRQLIAQALTQLRTGIAFARMYAADSPQLLRRMQIVQASWTELLASVGTVNFSTDRSDTLINGRRVELSPRDMLSVHAIEESLSAANLRGLTFHPGLNERELAAFLHALAGGGLAGPSGQEINRRLRQQGIEHIAVSEVVFVAMGEGDAVLSGAGSSWGGGRAGADPQAVLGMARKLLEGVAGIGDDLAREQVRFRTAEEILQGDQGLAGQVAASLAATDQAAGIMWPPAQTQAARCLQALGELGALLRQRGVDEAAAPALRKLLGELLAPYADKPESWRRLATAVAPELRGQAPEWLRSAAADQAPREPADRAADLVQFPPASLMKEPDFPVTLEVLDQLAARGETAAFRGLVEHLAGAAQVPQTQARAHAIQQLVALAERYREGPCAFDEMLEELTVEVARHESDEGVFEALMQYLGQGVRRNFAAGRTARAEACFQQIQDFSENANGIIGEASRIASVARDALADQQFVGLLLEHSLQSDQGRQAARVFLRGLGSRALPHVLADLQSCADAARCQRIVGLVQEAGAHETEWLLSQLGSEKDAEAALRLFSACAGLAACDAFWAQVPALLLHPGAEVRAAALVWCRRNSDRRCTEALAKAAGQESDPSRLSRILDAIASRADPAAIDQLGALLAREGNAALEPDLQVAVLDCLGAMGTPAILPHVAPVLQAASGAGFTTVLRRLVTKDRDQAIARNVCLAAIAALGRLHQNADAIALLEPLRRHQDAELSRAAASMLAALTRQRLSGDIPVRTGQAASPPREAAAAAPAHSARAPGREPTATASPVSGAPAQAQPSAQPAPRGSAKAPVPLKGLVAEVGLEKLLRGLAHRSGVLTLHTSQGVGRIHFGDGSVKEVVFQDLSGDAALEALAARQEAAYDFKEE